jgi:hypothetical protein
MNTLTHYSAKAVIADAHPDGWIEVVFSGLIDARAFAALQSAVMRRLCGAQAVVLRYDRAAIMVSQAQPIDVPAYEGAPVIAAVVTAAHLAIATQYAEGLGKLGAIAAVFSDTPAQIVLAHQWAARHAPASRSRSPA